MTTIKNMMTNFKSGSWKNSFKGSMQGFGMKVCAAKPEIMLVVGGISLLVGTIYACTKTEEAKKVISDAKAETDKINVTLPVFPRLCAYRL